MGWAGRLGNQVVTAWAGATRLPRGDERPENCPVDSFKQRTPAPCAGRWPGLSLGNAPRIRRTHRGSNKRQSGEPITASQLLVLTLPPQCPTVVIKNPGPIRQLSGGPLPGPLPEGASRKAREVGLGAVVGKSGRACLGWRFTRLPGSGRRDRICLPPNPQETEGRQGNLRFQRSFWFQLIGHYTWPDVSNEADPAPTSQPQRRSPNVAALTSPALTSPAPTSQRNVGPPERGTDGTGAWNPSPGWPGTIYAFHLAGPAYSPRHDTDRTYRPAPLAPPAATGWAATSFPALSVPPGRGPLGSDCVRTLSLSRIREIFR